MTAFALIIGALSCAPELKTAKSGKPYVTATIKTAADSESAQAELSRLGEGDKVSLQGALKFEVYISKDGEHKISRTLFVDQVLALRQPPRERKPKAAPPRAPVQSSDGRDFSDDIPF